MPFSKTYFQFLTKFLVISSTLVTLAQPFSVVPAAATIPQASAAGAPLQEAEKLQLTNTVLQRIANDKNTAKYAKYIAFPFSSISDERLARRAASASCRSFPGDPDWPEDDIWDTFDGLLGGALIPTIPVGAPCYDSQWGAQDAMKCAKVINNYTNALFHSDDPTSTMWPIFQGRTCMPKNSTSGTQCRLGGSPSYAVKVTNAAQVQLVVNFARNANLRLVIKNTGHCYLGKSNGAGALSLWMHNLKEINFIPEYNAEGIDYRGPALKLGAGVQVREAYEAADRNNVTVLGAVSWSVGYAGGMITGGGQNPLTGLYGMAADHVLAFNIVSSSGEFLTVTKTSNPDLFWAMRGGGGGTFGVVLSVVIRAHPRLNVVTSRWLLDATKNSEEKYWLAVRKFYETFRDWADEGLYTFFIHTKAGGLDMRYFFAPNHTLESVNRIVGPFFSYLEENNITLSTPRNDTFHTSFYSGYQAMWGAATFPIGSDSSLPANRIVPRRNFVEKYNQTYALIESHIKSGKHFLAYHQKPKRYADTDNAVNPAWRECLMFVVTSSNRSADHSTPEALKIQNKYLQNEILDPWRKISPVSEGGGAYLNEASVGEPDWQEAFYGGLYPKLSEIKKKWDPYDLFYATTAVGSERWRVEDGEQGVQTQNGRLCKA